MNGFAFIGVVNLLMLVSATSGALTFWIKGHPVNTSSIAPRGPLSD